MTKRMNNTMKRLGAFVALVAFMTMALPMVAFAATGTITLTPVHLPASIELAAGQQEVLSVTGSASNSEVVLYQWYENGVEIAGATQPTYPVTSAGNYSVTLSAIECQPVTSAHCIVTEKATTPTTPPANSGSGSVYITGYTVLNSAGAEVQKVGTGEKCKIIVSLRDGRFTAVPGANASGNIVNIKLTSTDNFATPSFGDIKQTTPKIENGELAYAVIFNDITYLGGSNTIAFDISYVDSANMVALQNMSVGISECYDIAGSSAGGAKPSIMVKDTSIGGGISVNAGDTFLFTINSFNTSTTAAVSDVKTTISLPPSLTFASGSNVVLNPSVSAGGTFSNTFSLQALSSAETGVANIDVHYEYYLAGSDVSYSSSQVITVPIVQPDRFSFTTTELPTEMFVGQENIITLNFVNKGKGILYNLTAEISGDISEPGQVQYLGNLASGTEGYVDFNVMAQTPGTLTGTMTLTYEDVNGAEQKVTQDYTLEVMEMQTGPDIWEPGPGDGFDPGMEGMDEEETGTPWWVWVLVGIGGITVIVVIVKVRKSRKAKRIAQELAEDDDDEDF